MATVDIKLADIIKSYELTNFSTSTNNDVIDNIIDQITSFEVSVEGTGDIFNCAFNLGDLDLDLDLDFFMKKDKILSYALLYKIQQLKRYINNINNIFIDIINDLNCCSTDDLYNKMILPIFKWLVEDENGLTGTLLKIVRELYSIYIPIKRMLCLFKPLPGNPTLSFGGTDFFKAIYPIIEGIEKAMNMIDSGRFLDIIIVPVKNFHDKLIACHSGEDVDLYNGYDNINDIVSTLMYDELTVAFINELKAAQEVEDKEVVPKPVKPIPPNYSDFYATNEKPVATMVSDITEYKKRLYEWNKDFSDYKYELDRQYSKLYAEYMKELSKYRMEKFKNTLELNEADYTSVNLRIDLTTEDIKAKYKPICGCLAEIFNADGFFFPKDKVIRTQKDLDSLIGHVEYRGINSENYYFDDEISGKKRIKIIKPADLQDIEEHGVKTDIIINMQYPFVKTEYVAQMAACNTISDVIALNEFWQTDLDSKLQLIKVEASELDQIKTSFTKMYQDDIKKTHALISKLRAELFVYKDLTPTVIADKNNEIIELQRQLTDYAFMPPKSWGDNKELYGGYASGLGNISWGEYNERIEKFEALKLEINELRDAIQRNHAIFEVVSDENIECGCDLICKIIKYIINIIMTIIKKLIAYIVNYIIQGIMNKELKWWIDFITQKIKCIIGLIEMGDEIEDMRNKFNREIESTKGLLKEASNSLGNCDDSNTNRILDEFEIYDDRAKVDPISVPDWEENTYPEWQDDTLDVTQNNDADVVTFKLTTENISYEDTEWRNRSIPTMVADCTLDHNIEVEWTPTSNSWSAFVNLSINYDQFNSSDETVINGNVLVNDESILNNAYQTIIYNLLNSIVTRTDYSYKFEISGMEYNANSDFSILTIDTLQISDTNIFYLNTIDKVWVDLENEWIKVYDRIQSDNLLTFVENTRNTINDINQNIENINSVSGTIQISTTSKVCSATNLTIVKFEPLYNNPDLELIYPGTLVRREETDDVYYVLTPKRDPDTLEYFTKTNVPYVLEMVNGSGRLFKVVLLIDICASDNVIRTSYNRSVDGVFLNDRYDYIEFDSIPNDTETVYTQTQIIEKLSKFLEAEGIISSPYPGPLSNSTEFNTDLELVDNIEAEEIYASEVDTSGENDNQIGIQNLPDGPLKTTIYDQQAKIEALTNYSDDLTNYVDTIYGQIEGLLNNNYLDINENEVNLNLEEINPFINYDSKLGIPIMVLNKEENIILTIHDKKLKLLNINRNIGILNPDLIIEQEIDYKEGEDLFIEFSSTGFTHTISWTNERKIKFEASVTTTTVIELVPTSIGSVYKDGVKIALLCGKINDLIFTNSNRPSEVWQANSNTYRPDGTLGYYDFSLFDGYHVYSIPPFFRITTFGELATVKGILYYAEDYTDAEVAALIQDGKINELNQSKLVVVGERPISIGGDFIWQNKVYYKNVTFGYLENFFCRDNLKGKPFTISYWLKYKDPLTNDKEVFEKQYIISDTHNGNFIWFEDGEIKIQLMFQPLISYPVTLIFKEDIYAENPTYVEKWFNHVFRYDYYNGKVYYDVYAIDGVRNFDENYDIEILNPKRISLPLNNVEGRGRVMDFSLVSMLARYDMQYLRYTDNFFCEISALAIWSEFKDDDFMDNMRSYQSRIIINENF